MASSLRRTFLAAPRRYGALFVLLAAACAPGSDLPPGTAPPGSGGGGGAGGDPTTSTSTTSTSSSSTGGGGGAGGVGPCEPDADGDQIPDEIEGMTAGTDTDGDNTPDFQDADSDGDSIPDVFEGQTASVGCNTPQDSDGDNTPDFQDTDSDNNGLPDFQEVYPDGSLYDPAKPDPNPGDSDGDGIPDYAEADNDGDSLLDVVELEQGAAADTDGDGLPDLDDPDSDDDGIADLFEGLADPDVDLVPAFRDLDSDDDGLSDACEAGPSPMPADPPPDADSDGKYDFLDLDSDGDGLSDAAEDTNLDCMVDPGETSPFLADTDGDAVSDFLEVVLETDARDPLETPGTEGKYYFILPFLEMPEPAENIVPLRTNLNQGDVAFLVDTTATMGDEIQNLKTGMATIVQSLYATIPDLAVGIAGFDDFPTGTYGTPGVDLPFYIAGPTGHVSTQLASNLGAIQALNVHDGGDFPESHVAAMHRAMTDTFLIWDSGTMMPTGAPGGRYGSLHFRNTALPILVAISDAPFHNGRRANNPGVLHDPYSFNGTPPFPTPTIDDLVSVMNARGARFIGVSARDGVRAGTDPYEDMAYLTDNVASNVSPAAFGGMLCGTGLLGALLPPDGPGTVDDPGGTCRLIFDATSGGAGVSESIITGVQALLQSIKFNLRVQASPLPAPLDSVDTFIQTIAVNAPGGADPAEPGVPCLDLNGVLQLTDIWSGPKGLVQVQDGVNETALGIIPTQKVCYRVVPKPNVTIPQIATAQVWKAVLTVKAKNGNSPTELSLGAPREIIFVVPPSPQ